MTDRRFTRKAATAAVCGAVALAVTAGSTAPAWAEANEVRFAQQFGLLYFPMHVVVDQKLVDVPGAGHRGGKRCAEKKIMKSENTQNSLHGRLHSKLQAVPQTALYASQPAAQQAMRSCLLN